MHVGFCGLGIMGSRMAANLVRAGHELTVWTRTTEKARSWAAEHRATAVEDPADVRGEVVITMLVDGPQVLDVAGRLGRGDGRLLVDMSTIGPAAAREVAAHAGAQGWAFVDAPVTGSSPKAEDGTLTIMAGGEEADVERARPLLEAMGSLIVHAGPVGHGQLVKLINNAVAAANAAALAQGLLVASAAGADLDALVQVMGAGSGGSAILDLKARPMRDHDWTTLFKAEHMLKDVRLCLEEAERAGVPFPAAAEARGALSAVVGRGLGDADFAALLEAYEGATGRRL
jgi:3-hydroxyisobutyrate dehydrogenase-like beta-hydroxyacid dehydrogenase